MKEGLENSKVGHLSLWPRWNAELSVRILGSSFLMYDNST